MNLESLKTHASKAFRVLWDFGNAMDDDEEGSFTGFLNCVSCDEWVAVTGTYKAADVEWIDRNEYRVRMCYAPRAIVPPPPIIELPEALPKDVHECVTEAFLLFWCDSAACVNRIRSCVELVLNRLKVPRSTIVVKNGKRKRERRFLHNRIDILARTRPELAQSFLAAKWIGNEGSHQSVNARQAALDAFEILEDALESLWGKHERRLRAIIRDVNRRKRPRRHRKS